MTTELKQRLEQMADRGEWRGADSIMTAARWDAEQPSTGPSLVTRPRYAWAIALGAAALVLVLVGGVAWWSAVMQHEEPVVDEPATTTIPELTPTTAPVVPVPTTVLDVVPTTTVPPVSPLSWTRIDDESFVDTAIGQLIPGGPGLIAVGEADEEAAYDQQRGDIAVWLSADGTTWERISDPSFSGEPDSGCASDFMGLQQSPFVVAVGPLGMIIGGSDACNGAVWISEDGRTWTEVVDDAWRKNPLAVGDVVAGGPGWVIVGSDGHGNGVVWVSPDGVEWTPSGDADLLAEEASRRIDLGGLAVLGEELVALGSEGVFDSTHMSGYPEAPAVIWTSFDGLEWKKLPAGMIDGGVVGLAVVDGGRRLVSIGYPTQAVPEWTLWTSTDVTTWTSMALPDAPGDGVLWNGDTIVTATGFVSTDGGITWIDAGEEIYGLGNAIARFDGRIFFAGTEEGVLARAGYGGSAGSTSSVWIGEWIEEEGS